MEKHEFRAAVPYNGVATRTSGTVILRLELGDQEGKRLGGALMSMRGKRYNITMEWAGTQEQPTPDPGTETKSAWDKLVQECNLIMGDVAKMIGMDRGECRAHLKRQAELVEPGTSRVLSLRELDIPQLGRLKEWLIAARRKTAENLHAEKEKRAGS